MPLASKQALRNRFRARTVRKTVKKTKVYSELRKLQRIRDLHGIGQLVTISDAVRELAKKQLTWRGFP